MVGQIVVELWRFCCFIVESLASFDFLGSVVWANAAAAGNLGSQTNSQLWRIDPASGRMNRR